MSLASNVGIEQQREELPGHFLTGGDCGDALKQRCIGIRNACLRNLVSFGLVLFVPFSGPSLTRIRAD